MKISPTIAAAMAAIATAPIAAAAASSLPGIVDQALAWLITAGVTALVSALAGAVAKITGAKLDQAARDTLQTALTNAANAAIPILISRARETAWGNAIDDAVDRMLAHTRRGAPDAVARFDLEATTDQAAHFRRMAEARLTQELRATAPDLLVEALAGAGVAARIPAADAAAIFPGKHR